MDNSGANNREVCGTAMYMYEQHDGHCATLVGFSHIFVVFSLTSQRHEESALILRVERGPVEWSTLVAFESWHFMSRVNPRHFARGSVRAIFTRGPQRHFTHDVALQTVSMWDLQRERLKHLMAAAILELWKKETGSLAPVLIEGTICITSDAGKTTVVQVTDSDRLFLA